MSKRTRDTRSTPGEITIVLSTRELRALDELAHYYHKSMGPIRYLIRITAAAEVRAKYRFIAEESLWLERFIKSILESGGLDDEEERSVEFAPRALIAFWGRVLSSLHSKRARRRMKPEDLATRERLNEKFRAAALSMEAKHPGSLDVELRTRRPTEVAWMQEQLREDTQLPRTGET